VDASLKKLLRRYAAHYETTDFLNGDPSCFMHQVDGDNNREATAFLASSLSFGSRKQFLPKIQYILDCAEGDIDRWVRSGEFEKVFPCNCNDCFYRFFTNGHMHEFLNAYRMMLIEYGTLGEYIKREALGDGYAAVDAICRFFKEHGSFGVIPQNVQSACKRVCMFLRWMVRDNSPVDIGLWSDFMDKRLLIIPLDTHVMQQSMRLGLLNGGTASMSVARRLTTTLKDVFPEDPLKGDFALFGYGVNEN
jgi:uncharacterized protein (TIGR02757 family)